MPKSSVSRAVARLEEQLGARLIERNSRQLKLTTTGLAYYSGAARALAELTGAEQAVSESQGEPRGPVRLTVPSGIDRGFLARVVMSFTRQYPAIRVDVSFSNRIVDLVGEGFDLAIRGGRLQDSSLIARKVTQLSLGLFAAPSYLERRRAPRRPADLKQHDCIVGPRSGETTTWDLTGPSGPERVEIAVALSSDDFFFVKELVLRGAGIALMVPPMDEVRSGSLIRVLADYEVPGLSAYVVIPSNSHLPRRVALFREALIAAFKTFPGRIDDSKVKVVPSIEA